MKRALQHLLWAVAVAVLLHYAIEWNDCAKRGGTWARTWHGNQCFVARPAHTHPQNG